MYEKDKKKSYEASRKPLYKGKDGKSYKKRQNVLAMGQESEHGTDSEDEVASQFEHMTLDAITMASIDNNKKQRKTGRGLHIQAKRDRKMIADIGVKVDTLPLRMFRKLYPEKIDKRGMPKPDVGRDRHTTIMVAYGGRTLLVQSIYENYWHNLKQIATELFSAGMHSGEVSLKHIKNPLGHLWGKQVKSAIKVTFFH